MRVFYIFSMKDEFMSLYKDSPDALFSILKHIYFMHESDIHYAFDMFNQLTNKIAKSSLDRRLFIELHKRMIYSKSGDQHIINNLYQDEISSLVVKNGHILITCNKNYSSFLEYLLEYNHNYFVCDFEYSDYFFLNQAKILASS
ncbi:MAG: sporulation inhibitor of replication protein SirA [Bacilli bacterium]